MTRYTYRIDRYFSETEGWGIETDDARGTEDYDGTAKECAKEIAQNRYDDLLSLGETGEWRVLVWESDTEGDEDDIDVVHVFTVTEEDLKPRGGRPKIGNIVSIAMGDTLPRVDAYATNQGIKRAEAIRTLVTIGLQAETEDATAAQIRALHRDWNQAATIDRGEEYEPITKADILASIDSYIEAGGEVDAQGEPLEWETVTAQLNS